MRTYIYTHIHQRSYVSKYVKPRNIRACTLPTRIHTHTHTHTHTHRYEEGENLHKCFLMKGKISVKLFFIFEMYL
jgi:hypothetical protein